MAFPNTHIHSKGIIHSWCWNLFIHDLICAFNVCSPMSFLPSSHDNKSPRNGQFLFFGVSCFPPFLFFLFFPVKMPTKSGQVARRGTNANRPMCWGPCEKVLGLHLVAPQNCRLIPLGKQMVILRGLVSTGHKQSNPADMTFLAYSRIDVFPEAFELPPVISPASRRLNAAQGEGAARCFPYLDWRYKSFLMLTPD